MLQPAARWSRAFRLALFCLIAVVGLSHAAESPREWRRRGSDKTLEAVYITIQDGKVVIARVSDGRQAGVNFDDLSDADQAYVVGARQRELAAVADGTATAPDAAPAPVAAHEPDPVPARESAPAAAPASTPRASANDSLSPSDAMDMADAENYDEFGDGEHVDDFDEFDGLPPIDINWVLVAVLGVMNVPLYLLWGKLFFGDVAGFFTSLRFALTPDIVSFFRGEYGEDRWEQAKMGLWIILCILCVIAEYKIIGVVYTKIFG